MKNASIPTPFFASVHAAQHPNDKLQFVGVRLPPAAKREAGELSPKATEGRQTNKRDVVFDIQENTL